MTPNREWCDHFTTELESLFRMQFAGRLDWEVRVEPGCTDVRLIDSVSRAVKAEIRLDNEDAGDPRRFAANVLDELAARAGLK